MSNPIQSLLDDQFVDMAFIVTYTGMTDKWFYKLISLGQFPPAIKFGRSSRWLKSEVLNWVTEKVNTSRLAQPSYNSQTPHVNL